MKKTMLTVTIGLIALIVSMDAGATCPTQPIPLDGIINQSGTYCAENNITGTIQITASNVELDLNSFQLDGDGADYALVISNVTSVSVKNGHIVNTLPNNGVKVSQVSGFELSDLDISSCNRALLVENSTAGRVSRLNLFDNVNSDIEEGSAVLSISESSCTDFTDVQLCRNIKNLNLPVENPTGGASDSRNGIISLTICNDINFSHTKVNDNFLPEPTSRLVSFLILSCNNCTFDHCEANGNSTPVVVEEPDDVPPQWVISYQLVACENCDFTDCQANNNRAGIGVTFVGYFVTGASFEAETRACRLLRCEANYNTVEAESAKSKGTFRVGIWLQATQGCAVEHCQVNGNATNQVAVDPADIHNREGVVVTFSFGTVISHVMVANNRHDEAEILCEVNQGTLITDCQIFNNFTQGDDHWGIECAFNDEVKILGCTITDNVSVNNPGSDETWTAGGILIRGYEDPEFLAQGYEIRDCTVARPSASAQAVGMLIINYVKDVVISDCTCFGARAYLPRYVLLFPGQGGAGIDYEGFAGGLIMSAADNVSIKRCNFYDNKQVEGRAFGLRISDFPNANPDGPPSDRGCTNVSISACNMFENSSENNDAAGLYINASKRVFVDDVQIADTVSTALTGYAAGADIENSNDVSLNNVQSIEAIGTKRAAAIALRHVDQGIIDHCEALRSSSPEGCGYGVLTTEGTTHSIIKDSIALCNKSGGFADKTECKSFFYGNTAENNGKDYIGIAGEIVSFDKKKGRFDSIPTRWSNTKAKTKKEVDRKKR